MLGMGWRPRTASYPRPAGTEEGPPRSRWCTRSARLDVNVYVAMRYLEYKMVLGSRQPKSELLWGLRILHKTSKMSAPRVIIQQQNRDPGKGRLISWRLWMVRSRQWIWIWLRNMSGPQ